MRQYLPRLQRYIQQHQSCISGIRKKYKQNDKDNSDTHKATWAKRLDARCWFSKSPVHFKEYPSGRWIAAFTFFCASATVVPMSRPRTENLTAQKRVWLSLKISKVL